MLDIKPLLEKLNEKNRYIIYGDEINHFTTDDTINFLMQINNQVYLMFKDTDKNYLIDIISDYIENSVKPYIANMLKSKDSKLQFEALKLIKKYNDILNMKQKDLSTKLEKN